ncbi:hypothetical protein QUA81_21755 [Microcoleus sp. F6_B4]
MIPRIDRVAGTLKQLLVKYNLMSADIEVEMVLVGKVVLITRNLPLATEFLTTATSIESAIVRFGNIGDRNECSINPGLSLHAHTIIDLSLKNSRIGKNLFRF